MKNKKLIKTFTINNLPFILESNEISCWALTGERITTKNLSIRNKMLQNNVM